MVKHLPAARETWVLSLGWESPLGKDMTTHSSTLAWKGLWMEEPGRLQSMGSQRVGHDWATPLVHCKVSNYLKTCSASPCCHYPDHRVPRFCSPPWTPFRGWWRSAAAAAHDLIFVEVRWQVPICSWQYDSLYMKYPEDKSRGTKSRWRGLPGASGSGDWLLMQMEFSLGVMTVFQK